MYDYNFLYNKYLHTCNIFCDIISGKRIEDIDIKNRE